MNKRLLSILLVLAMVITMVPAFGTVAYADTTYEVADENQLSAAIASGGSIKLTTNVTITNTLSIANGTSVTFDLNGYVLKAEGNISVIKNMGMLTITDSSLLAIHYYTVNNDGLWVWNDSSTTGAISLIEALINPSSITSGAIIAVTGGSITGGSANLGAGVYNTGTLHITGGNIIGNTQSNVSFGYTKGGGIFSASNLYISAGNIIGNVANNTSWGDMKGVGIYSSGSFEMIGGTVAFNKQVATSTLSCYGAGVFIDNNTFIMSGSAQIIGNETTNNGGGVYIDGENATFTMTSGSISYNKASQGAGVTNYGTFKLESGNISFNKASNQGGGLHNEESFIMSGGEISYNYAPAGAGMKNMDSCTMIGGKIINNQSNDAKYGAGIFNINKPIVLGGDATISGNTDVNGISSNLYLYNNTTVTICETTPPALMLVGVTSVNTPKNALPVVISEDVSVDYCDHFVSDVDAFYFIYTNDKIQLATRITGQPTNDATTVTVNTSNLSGYQLGDITYQWQKNELLDISSAGGVISPYSSFDSTGSSISDGILVAKYNNTGDEEYYWMEIYIVFNKFISSGTVSVTGCDTLFDAALNPITVSDGVGYIDFIDMSVENGSEYYGWCSMGLVGQTAFTISDIKVNQLTAISDQTTDTLTITNPGDYACEITFKDGSSITSDKVAITSKGAQTATGITMDDYAYNGIVSTPSVNGATESPTVTWTYGADNQNINEEWDTVAMKTLTPGAYYVRASVAETANYNSTTLTSVFVVNKGANAAPTIASVTTDDAIKVTIANSANKKYEYKIDSNSWTAVRLDANGSFILTGLSESTNYTLYVRERGNNFYNASAEASTNFTTPAKYSVAYDANGGKGTVPSSQIANSGSTLVVSNASGLTRNGYTFAGWNTKSDGSGTSYAAGSSISTGTILYAQWTANKYTVNFNSNGGNGSMDGQSFTYDVAQALTNNNFVKSGYYFAGWATSPNAKAALYKDGQSVKNLAKNGTATLYAVWVKDVYSLTVNISSSQSSAAAIKLMKGSTIFNFTSNVTLSGSGNSYIGLYTFENVVPGTYNVVVSQGDSDDITMTKLVKVKQNASVNIEMPEGAISSALEITGADTPQVVVDGLSEEAAAKALHEKSVRVNMTIEKKEEQTVTGAVSDDEYKTQEAIAAIKEKVAEQSADAINEYMNIDMTQSIKETGKPEVKTAIIEANTIQEIFMNFDLAGKKNIKVFRHHNEETAELTKVSPDAVKADGTFYIDEEESAVVINANKFSTYSISYEDDIPQEEKKDNPGSIVIVNPVIENEKETEQKPVKTTESAVCKKDSSCVASKFTDLNLLMWYHDGIHYCVENGLMDGIDTNIFNPYGSTTRAMLVTILWRMAGSPVVDYAMSFSDVSVDRWYAEAVRWAASEGIVSGYLDGTFKPNDAITREAMAQILYGYAKTKGQGFTGSWMFLLSNPDADKISFWANEAMHWTVMKQITKGDAEGKLNPKGTASRAEVAAMIQRFAELTN